MATPNTLTSSEYWMSPDALTIELNALDNPQYLQVSLLAGSVITAFRQDVINYDASLNFRKWNLQAYNNFFDRTDRAYVYAQLDKNGNNALIIYSYDALELTETITSDTEESKEVYNVYLGTISASVNSSGESIPRSWETTFDTGRLNTDQYKQEDQLGEWSKMFRLNKVTDMIEVLKDITSAVIHKLYIGARKILVSDVQTSSESDKSIEASDSIIPTTKFLKESTEAKFHRKDQTDENPFLQKFLGGIESKDVTTDKVESRSFTSGAFGSGYTLKRNAATGRSYMEIDEIYVRLKAYFDNLQIKHLSHVGGRFVMSPAGMECNKVEIVDGEFESLFDSQGDILYDSQNDQLKAVVEGGEQVYRCYFKDSDGEKEIVNEFAVDDLAQCREFNIKEGVYENVTNQYYWRRVVNVGSNYIDLSMTDCDSGSTVPMAGDTIVTIGNKTDANRQHVLYLSSFDDDAPSIKLYSGINSYSMLNKEVTVISPNADKNVFTGKVVIKPGSEGFGNLADAPDMSLIEQEIQNAKDDAQSAKDAVDEAKGDVVDLKDYVNGAFADDVITSAEAKAIETYINTVNNTSQSAEKEYNELYNNEYLDGSAKVELQNAYSIFADTVEALINSIQTAIADGKTTQGEKDDVNLKYDNFNQAYSNFTKAIEVANQAIQDKLKGYSDNAQLSADQAQAIANQVKDDVKETNTAVSDLSNYVDGAFSDGIITQAEAKAIATYINTVTTTKKECDATYITLYNNPYLVGTAKSNLSEAKSKFNTAASNLITAIQSAIADGVTTQVEKNNVDTKFTEYNTAYANLATFIENANKAIQDKIKEEAISEVKSDLDSQIGSVSLSDKNEIAKYMGYADYEELVYYAERAQTIIKGGHINAELIETSLLITSQIIANAIKANMLNVNDNFIVNTDGSVNANGTITSQEDTRQAILSNGFLRLMAMPETLLQPDEVLRISSNEDYEPEIFMRGRKYGMRYLSITPNGFIFDTLTSSGKRINLTIDPTIIGEGMTNAVIKKTSDGMLYIAESEETKYKLSISASEGGTTTPAPGDYYVASGRTLYVEAQPNVGYEFERWSDGGAQRHSITVSYDLFSVTAYFRKKDAAKYTLSLYASPSNAGTVNGGGSYNEGELVYINALANSGYRFVRWSDGGAQMHGVTVDSNKSLTAYFEAYTVVGDELFSGTDFTDSSYWEFNGGSLVFVSGGVATLFFKDNADVVDAVYFNKGMLDGKLKKDHSYLLTLTIKSSKESYIIAGITYNDFDNIISSEGLIYGSYNGGDLNEEYKNISLTFKADRDSNNLDGFMILANPSCFVYIKDISLKEI